ncbi:hypothetical protein [Streptomyces indicus]|uniref:Uncharacterized protein n=1 Tax=Streptomyces indicus TaxID=417292 RepID=A0A1G9GC07_9ACTN|nr:hypothetical protein [Streptomyces indicus]SDK97803.1 hypothetical protein SAMN05421806_11597 [Streptomyces indicus]
MEIAFFSGLLALVVFGLVCIVWAQLGGPRWVRVIAAITQGAGAMARAASKSGRSGGNGSSSSTSDD